MSDEEIMNADEQAAADAAVAAHRANNTATTEADAIRTELDAAIRETFGAFILASIIGFFLPTQPLGKLIGEACDKARWAAGTIVGGTKVAGPQAPFHADYVNWGDKGRTLGISLMKGKDGMLSGGFDSLVLGLTRGIYDPTDRWGDAWAAAISGVVITKDELFHLLGFYQVVQGEGETDYHDLKVATKADFDTGAAIATKLLNAINMPKQVKGSGGKASRDVKTINL